MYCNPDDLRRRGRSALPQQRQRHVHRRLAAGRHRQSGGQGAGRGVLRLRSRRRHRHLRRQRSGAQFSLPQQRRRHVPGRRVRGRRRLRHQRQAAGRHGRRLRRRRRRRLSRALRHQLLRRAEHALREPRRRHCSRTSRRRPGSARASCRSASARSCSTSTTTATSTSTSPTATSSTTSSCISRTLSYEQKDLLYENVGGDGSRTCRRRAAPALQAPRVGRGLAVADFDNDGYLDVAISSLGRRAVLLRNRGRLEGQLAADSRRRARSSNRFGLGATVRVQTAGRLQVREINNAASYLSANDTRLHVGLGDGDDGPAAGNPLAERHQPGARET